MTNLCFCTNPSDIRNILMQSEDLSEIKEAAIGLCQIVEVMHTNQIHLLNKISLLENKNKTVN